MTNEKPKRVFITGVTRGLGLAFAEALLAQGHRVFGSFRMASEMKHIDRLSHQWPQQFTAVQLDVADQEMIQKIPQVVQRYTSALDILINNAGINSRSSDLLSHQSNMEFGKLEMSGMLKMFQTNALGPMLLMQSMARLLQKGKRPLVVNLSSRRGSIHQKLDGGNYGYCTSKSALNMLTRAAAADLRATGVIVVAIHPGVLKTDMGLKTATLSAAESAASMIAVMEKLSLRDTGQFFNWDGTKHPW